MLRLKSIALFLLCATSALNASAQTLNTFVDGQPAVAAQVNQNFTLLLNEINSLKAQLAALQPAALSQAIVGTWDVVSLDTTQFQAATQPSYNFFIRSSGGKSVLVLRADGTFTSTYTGHTHQVQFFNTRTPVLLPAPAGSTAPSGGAAVKSDLYIGIPPVAPESDSFSGTYTVSGTTLTLRVGGESLAIRVSQDANVMTLYQVENDMSSISVALKR